MFHLTIKVAVEINLHKTALTNLIGFAFAFVTSLTEPSPTFSTKPS